ncbi:glycosyltransferase family 4 protein [Listeria aquatica]|uniref:Glycosyltransferase family 4 protein n=1 Tax=Listeria aquatica TaxID=1494960 RepID=A0A841ZM21_9LIST|nr:glycosyltransferase family 4 protein [Listeria aquatica]MBC1521336.1 glycosyltransferase family 4 protein [Listeria aquatica]
MNILMIGPDSKEKGGIATVVANFKTYYSSADHQLFFLSSWSREDRWLTEWRALFSIRKIIFEKKIDIVHFHVAQKGSFFRKMLLRKLIPHYCKIVFHMHASQFDVFYQKSSSLTRKWIRQALNKIDHIVVLGGEWEKFYRRLTRTPISVIQNAVCIPETVFFNKRARSVVTFGQIGKRKGSYDLLEVAKNIEPIFPDICFTLYGDGEVEKVQKQIEKMRLTNVKLGGWVRKSEQEKILKNTLLHYLPSYHEGLPMAVLETMAAGIPNMSTDVGSISDAVKNGKNGILTKSGDIAEMTKQMLQFLEHPTLQMQYSRNAREKIEKEFSIKHYNSRWTQFYNSIYLKE